MLNWWRERRCSENRLQSGLAFRVRHNPTEAGSPYTVHAVRELARKLQIQYATRVSQRLRRHKALLPAPTSAPRFGPDVGALLLAFRHLKIKITEGLLRNVAGEN